MPKSNKLNIISLLWSYPITFTLMTEINCSILGDAHVGKTSYILRHVTGEFHVSPPKSDKTYNLKFATNYGVVNFNIYDGILDNKTNCVIFMFDLTNKQTLLGVESRIKTVRKQLGVNPILLCGNKIDLKEIKIKPKEIRKFIVDNKIYYYPISARSNYNFEKPILYMMRKVLGNENVTFVEWAL